MVPKRDVPKRDIANLRAGDVLHSPSSGFAVVDATDPQGATVKVRWEGPARDAPRLIDLEDGKNGLRLCPPGGFLERSVRAPDALRTLVASRPADGLELLVSDIDVPLSKDDVRRWMVGRGVLTARRFEQWWPLANDALADHPRLSWQRDRLTRRATVEDDPTTSFLRSSPRERLARWQAADEAQRGRWLEAAIDAGDQGALQLLLRDHDDVPEVYSARLEGLALAGATEVAAALLERYHEPLLTELAARAADRGHRPGIRRAIDQLPEPAFLPVLMQLITHALEGPGGEPAALFLSGLIREEDPDPIEWLDLQGESERFGAARAWFTAHAATQTLVGEPRDARTLLRQLAPVKASRILGLGLRVAEALARRHAEGVYGGLETARLGPEGAIELGPPEDTTAARDVHDAARLLIELAVGRLPWGASVDSEVLLYHLRQLSPGIPLEFMAVAARALAPEPEQRPRNGSALWAELAQAVALARVRGSAPSQPGALYDVGHDTHIGVLKSRLGQVNQDALFFQLDEGLSLLIVADGISVSTAGSGNLASAILVQVVAGLWEQRYSRLKVGDGNTIREFLVDALAAANRAICEGSVRLAGGDLGRHIPMGTTALLAVLSGNQVHLASLGDSRAYLITRLGAALLTGDQNLRGEWLLSWQRDEPIEMHNEGHALVGYCGHFDEQTRPAAVPPQVRMFTMLPDEILVLASDGLTDYAANSAAKMARIMEQTLIAGDLSAACRRLVEHANAGGGGDNITVMVARLEG